MLSVRTLVSCFAFAVSAPSLLLGPGLGHLVGSPVRSAHAGPATGPIFVPYPDGLRLIAVTEGSMRGTPALRSFDLPETWNGLLLIPYRHAGWILDRLDGVVDEEQHVFRQMRQLAIESYVGSHSTNDRVLLDAEFQRHIAQIEHLSGHVAYRGATFLDGAQGVYFEGRPPGFEPIQYWPEDLSATGLALTGASFDLTTAANAFGTLSVIDTAIESVLRQRSTLGLFRRQVEDGAPAGGLLEIQDLLERARDTAVRAASGTLNTGDRYILDTFFQDDLERIDRVAEAVAFEGLPLLNGEADVVLQGPPPTSLPIQLDLPDVTRTTLELSGASFDVRSVTNASFALQGLDKALDRVTDHRRELEAARERLTRVARRIQ